MQHTPQKTNTGSHPNLAFVSSEDRDQTAVPRYKKKIPDSEQLIMNEFKQELTSSLGGFRQELSVTLKEFQESMMASFDCILAKHAENIHLMRDEIRVIKSDVLDIQESCEKLRQAQHQLTSDFMQIKKDGDHAIEHSSHLDKRADSMKELVSELTEQLRLKDQDGRRNNLEISGVPLKKDENLLSILNRMSIKVGFTLVAADVDYIHRVRRFIPHPQLPGNNEKSTARSPVPNIMVRFTQRKRKSELLAAICARRGLSTADLDIDGASSPVYVSDHLTPHYKLLYRRVREQAKQLDFKYVWLNDCKIFIRKSDTSKVILIGNEADLTKIK